MVTLWTLPPVVRWVSVTQAAGSSPKTASGWAAENLSLNSWLEKVTWLS